MELKIEKLSKRFKDKRAVDDSSLIRQPDSLPQAGMQMWISHFTCTPA